jgi:hypothetical protein
MASGVTPRPARYSRASAPSGSGAALRTRAAAASCRSRSLRRCPGFGGFFGGVEFAFGERNAAFLGDGSDGFREGEVLYLADKAEDISGLAAAEAVVELAAGVDGEGWGFFFVEGAEAGVVLRAGFAQADVAADDFDDVGLLLDGLGEVGHVGTRGSFSG